MVTRLLRVAMLAGALALPSPASYAQGGPGGATARPGMAAGERPNLLQDIRYDQQLDAQLPLDLVFRDESGQSVELGRYFGRRPVILALVYYECPMLCTQVLNGLTGALKTLSFNVGREFDVVVVSFNPREGPGLASQKKASYLERYGRPQTADNWHFLTGPDASIAQLAKTVGFKYVWDEQTSQYAHAAGVMVVTPQGRISKYFFGVEYAPRDLRFGVIQAADQKIGTPVDQLLLYCYHYDPTTGQYGLIVMRAVQIGGVVLMLAMATFWVAMWRLEKREARLAGAAHKA